MIQALFVPALVNAAVIGVPQSSFRLDLVANVPVACSSTAITSAEGEANGLKVQITGGCNTDHLVRVRTNAPFSGSISAALDGAPGLSVNGRFVFRRAAFFKDSATLSIEIDDESQEQVIRSSDLIVEISPD